MRDRSGDDPDAFDFVMDCRLVKAGYGTLEAVRRMTSRDYLQALAYEKFCADYAAAFRQANTPERRAR